MQEQLAQRRDITPRVDRYRAAQEVTHKGHEDPESFNTFIVKYVGKKEFSFNNVDVPEDGTDERRLKQFWNLEGESQDGQTVFDQHNSELNSNMSFYGHPGSHNEDKLEGTSFQQSQFSDRFRREKDGSRAENDRRFSSKVTKGQQADVHENAKDASNINRMVTQHACSLQMSINDQNVAGTAFNRKDAEFKIEKDFRDNNKILKA